jgi:hypothetical protein
MVPVIVAAPHRISADLAERCVPWLAMGHVVLGAAKSLNKGISYVVAKGPSHDRTGCHWSRGGHGRERVSAVSVGPASWNVKCIHT